MNKPSVIIVGAGLSGLTAARELSSRGFRVTVLDKSRGLGGRLATRRIEGATFDHGAQFFTVKTPEFREFLTFWETDCTASEWYRGYPSPNGIKPKDDYPRFRGLPGMTALAKSLARNLDVQLNSLVTEVRKNGHWTVTLENGLALSADWLILTSPVPQSLTLLDSGGVTLEEKFRASLQDIEYQPCFALLVQLDGPSKVPSPGALHLDGDVLTWIADNFQKGVSAIPGALTIHASGDWSQTNFNLPYEEVARIMLQEAAPYLGSSVSTWQIHRWRYAKPCKEMDLGSVEVKDRKLIFAGDAFCGSKVEGAVLSGLAAAKNILTKEKPC